MKGNFVKEEVAEEPITLARSPADVKKTTPVIAGFVQYWKNLFKPAQRGSEKLKASLDATLTRRSSYLATAAKAEVPEEEETFSTTLRRNMTTKNRSFTEVLNADINERDAYDSELSNAAFSPLDIPAPTDAEVFEIKSYRMPPRQYQTLTSTLALFSGTHNFHNYIRGSVQDDSRCFVHIFNIEASPLEIHNGMEWVRVKVQAQTFAHDQFRRMMGIYMNLRQRC